jgi:hypothetical protein
VARCLPMPMPAATAGDLASKSTDAGQGGTTEQNLKGRRFIAGRSAGRRTSIASSWPDSRKWGISCNSGGRSCLPPAKWMAVTPSRLARAYRRHGQRARQVIVGTGGMNLAVRGPAARVWQWRLRISSSIRPIRSAAS